MVGSKSEQMIEADNVGVELIKRGWKQGSLLPTPSAVKSWLILAHTEEPALNEEGIDNPTGLSGTWKLQQEALDQNDFLIITSQACDIQRSPRQEPYIEVIRAYYTSKRSVIHEAGKNSIRRFLIERHTTNDGKIEALIADATVRILIGKSALLLLAPLAGFKENDTITPRQFRQWLAKRYDRLALPDEIVNALQKPIVKAVGKLHEADKLHYTLDGISEILFFPHNDAIPYKINLLFIRDERGIVPEVSNEDAETLAGWISNVLRKDGKAELINWEILSTKQISVYDYSNALELSLDQFSLAQDDTTL